MIATRLSGLGRWHRLILRMHDTRSNLWTPLLFGVPFPPGERGAIIELGARAERCRYVDERIPESSFDVPTLCAEEGQHVNISDPRLLAVDRSLLYDSPCKDQTAQLNQQHATYVCTSYTTAALGWRCDTYVLTHTSYCIGTPRSSKFI